MSTTPAEQLNKLEASIHTTITELERIATDNPLLRHRRKAAAGLKRAHKLLKRLEAARETLDGKQ